METLSLEHNNLANKKLLFLFVFLQLLIITSIFLLNYKNTMILLTALTFLILNFLDVRITLWLLIAYSTRIIYFHGLVSAIMMVILGFILIFVLLSGYFKFCLEELKIKKTKLNLPIAAFLGLAFLQAVRGFLISNPPKWVGTEFFAYLGFGVVFLVISLCDSKEMIKKFFQLLIVVAYYHAITGLWNYFRVGHRIGGYLFGTFPSLVALVLLNLSFYTKEKSKKSIYFLLSIPLILHLLFGFTRGYWLGFLVALLFSYGIYITNSVYSFSEKVFKFLRGVTVSTIIIMVSLFGFQQFLSTGSFIGQVSKRFLSSFSTKPSAETMSNVARLVEYPPCWDKIKKRPILGYGVGYTLPVTNPVRHRRAEEWAIHQFYLMITLKMGLVGLLVFLWMYYVFFKEGLKGSKKIEDSYYKGLSYGFIANSIEQLTISFTNHQFATVDNNFYLAFTMAGVLVIISKRDLD
jgi:O-antigen ligase